MLKYLFLIFTLFTTSLLFSAEKEKFQILAKHVNSKDDIVIAKDDVVIFSPSYYILAQKAIYDKKNATFELFDDVIIVQNNNVQAQSNYAFLDIDKDILIQNPVLMLEQKTNVWMNAKESYKEKNIINMKNSILSSCDCINPAWTIRFTSGDYDDKDKWLNTYNTRLYIKDIPLFYTPYLGFSTDTTRRTGLLPPTVGYSKTEGVTYTQPIFIAPKPNWDLELRPQVRTTRGYGMYAYFRMADSEYSNLKINTGIFQEQDEYFKKNNLKNQKHFGYDIDYERTKLFSNGEDEDGLFASINWMNDIEYLNLDNNNYTSTEKKVESKINYYYETPQRYYGTYFRYYLDTTLDSNDSVMQELPQAQYHTFTKSIFTDKLLYSVDAKYTNYYRNTGIDADKYEVVVPVSYSFSFFDDYLNLTLKEELTAIQQNYSHETSNYENGTYLENRHIVKLSTDLLKKYDAGIHTMNIGTILTIPNTIKKEGDFYDTQNPNSSELSPFPITEAQKTLSFALNQSYYDSEDLKQIINHKINQSIIYNKDGTSDLGNLENEITYNYLLGYVSNKLLYSNLDHEIVENSSTFKLDYLDYYLKLDYYMSKKTPNSGKEDLESYTVDAGVRFLRDYTFSYYENYNLEKDIRSKQSFIFAIDDKCWNLNIKYEKEIEPSSSTTAQTKQQDIVYLELTLKPLGQIKQKYKVKDTSIASK